MGKLSEKDRKEICRLYEEGWSTRKIASHFRVGSMTIWRALKESNIEIRSQIKLSKEDKEEICRLYEGGWNTYQIARRYRVNNATIGNVLKKTNTKMRKHTPKYTYNPYAFDELTYECNHTLGIIATDGCVRKQGNSYVLSLGLKESDKEYLEKFRTFLGSNHKIYKDSSRPMCYICITLQEHTVKKLEEYGIVPRKTLIINPPDYLFENRHFLRGCIDGDGSLGIDNRGRPRISFTSGSKMFIEKICKKFNEITGSKVNVGQHGNNKYAIGYACRKAYKIIKYLYKDVPDHMVLARKKARAEEVFKIYDD